MDATRFDRWARTFFTTRSRRGAIGLLIAGALAGTVGSEVDAKKKGKGKKKGCKKSEKKCGNRCVPKAGCCTSDACVFCAGEVCQPDGACRCNPGTSQYNGVCGTKPNCLSAGGLTGGGPSNCCSGNAILDREQAIWACLPGHTDCLSDFDCVTGPIGRCKGFMCPELYQQVQPGSP